LAIGPWRATLRAVSASLAIALLLGLAPPAAPAPGGHPIEIGWQAPPGCPDAAWARAEVERFVGDSLQATRATQLSFEVSITADAGSGWIASIVTITDGGRRRRRLPHEDCERLSEAAALIIAMAIDPAALDVADEAALGALARAEPAEEVAAPTEAEPAEAEPTASTPERAAPEPVRAPEPPHRFAERWIGPRLAFDLGVGRLPTIDVGGTLGVTAGVGPLRFELVGGALGPRTVAVEAGEASFVAWSVAARVGWALRLGPRVELPLLVGVDLGQLRARGRGLPQASSAAPPIGHVHLVPGVIVWIAPNLGLGLELDAFVPWARPSFTVDGHGTVFRALPVGVHAGLGMIARFPRRPPSR
jgi:hypothetical protein